MGKYEEEFLQNQIEEWKDKYITYSSFKQKIKQYIIDMTNKSISEISQIEKNEILTKYIKEFTGELDKEIRKIYVFFHCVFSFKYVLPPVIVCLLFPSRR